jgi:hypothetical protein
MQHKYVQSLRIVDANGNDKVDGSSAVIPVRGNVVFEAGANMTLTPSDNTVGFAAGYGLKPPDPDMLAKWNAVINGGSGTAQGISYSFTGVPYYISKIGSSGTQDGFYFLGVDKCYHTGQFLDYEHPEPDYASYPGKLGVLDTCPACIDCPEFYDIDRYIMKIQDFYDFQKDTLLSDELESSESETPAGVLNQYIGMIEKWNYIVNLKSWRYNAEAKGDEVYASCKYTNHTDQPIPPGMTMTIDFSNAPGSTRAFFIDTAIKTVQTFSRTDCAISRPTQTSVRLTTTAGLWMGEGIRFYCGSLSPYYTGTDTRVQVNFDLTFPSGGIGDKTRGFNTNLMVAIDPSGEYPPWTSS